MGKLDDRIALITASGRNIGRACALRFAAEGADVIVNARTNADEVNAVADEIRALGRQAIAVVADIADPAGIRTLVDRSLEAFGRIDVLLNVAAIRPHKPFLELQPDEWRRVRGVVLDGGLLLTQAVLPTMVEHGRGSVVFFVGDGAWAGGAQRAHVSAAKMGLVGLCRGLASEFAPAGLRFNVVSPGRIDTSRDTSWYPTSMTRVDDIPLGRLGSPDDIASACLFLASDDSSYVTGQTLHVNGGSAYF